MLSLVTHGRLRHVLAWAMIMILGHLAEKDDEKGGLHTHTGHGTAVAS